MSGLGHGRRRPHHRSDPARGGLPHRADGRTQSLRRRRPVAPHYCAGARRNPRRRRLCRPREEPGRGAKPIWGPIMADALSLAITDLHAFYGDSHVLHGVTLDVPAGECVTIIGRNGAGKTTTLRVHHGADRPAQGIDPGRRPERHRRSAGADRPPRRRLRAGRTRHLRHAGRHRKPAAAAQDSTTAACRSTTSTRLFPEPQRAPPQPGHAALRRRTADAGHRPRAAHRRLAVPAR